MQIGMVGLGKMGGNMARRLHASDFDVIGYDHDHQASAHMTATYGVHSADSLEALILELDSPRLIWLMLPAGNITETTIDTLGQMLEPGDVIVDGANSYYRDSVRRGDILEKLGMKFLDAGVSGGVWGREKGYSLMIGGTNEAFSLVRPFVEALAPSGDHGWLHTGAVGSGHFSKMVHNGIEYGMMQAYAEGFALLKGRDEFNIDLAAIAECWRHGSVIRSWLLDLSAEILQKDQSLNDVEPIVADSGEGRWAALEGIEQGIPTPVMSLSLMTRFASQGGQDFAAKLLALMRNQFGGHVVPRSNDK